MTTFLMRWSMMLDLLDLLVRQCEVSLVSPLRTDQTCAKPRGRARRSRHGSVRQACACRRRCGSPTEADMTAGRSERLAGPFVWQADDWRPPPLPTPPGGPCQPGPPGHRTG